MAAQKYHCQYSFLQLRVFESFHLFVHLCYSSYSLAVVYDYFVNFNNFHILRIQNLILGHCSLMFYANKAAMLNVLQYYQNSRDNEKQPDANDE